MKKIDSFTKLYGLNKTLQFKLIPQGKTLDNFLNSEFLSQDEKRNVLYKHVKTYIDEYHRSFIDSALKDLEIDVTTFSDIYYKSVKTEEDKKNLKTEEQKLRTVIFNKLKNSPDYEKLFKKEILQILPDVLTEENQKEDVAFFNRFATYFSAFQNNRKNIYTEEEKSTGIPYRCINDNLPKFLDNAKAFSKIVEALSESALQEITLALKDKTEGEIADWFNGNNFSRVLTSKGIATYNQIIGGYALEDGAKIKGINEYVNEYNQINKEKLPNLTTLYKQILSEKTSNSFVLDKFEGDKQVVEAIKDFYAQIEDDGISKVEKLFKDLSIYNAQGVFIENGPALTDLSQKLENDWRFFKSYWEDHYDKTKKVSKVKDVEKYEEKREKEWKKNKSFSVFDLAECFNKEKILEYYQRQAHELSVAIKDAYNDAQTVLFAEHKEDAKLLPKSDTDVEVIKNLLDSIKNYERLLSGFNCKDVTVNKDVEFYGVFSDAYLKISQIDRLYDKVRNYVTQKPYSTDKIKLNFDNPQFLGGWDKNKEHDYSAQVFRKDGEYYIAIRNKSFDMKFKYEEPISEQDIIEKMEYKQMASPTKDIPNLMVINGKTVKKNGRKDDNGENSTLEKLKNENLPKEINEIRKSKSYLESSSKFNKDSLTKYIQYYMDRIKDYYNEFDFTTLNNAAEYDSYKDFIDHVGRLSYQIKFIKVSWQNILNLVVNGELYLFKIYNKDFSEYSKGKPNLHTLYFKALFDPKNLENPVYKLDGEAEMFYRFKSIEKNITHPKNNPIKNKNPYTKDVKGKEFSTFEYDLIKDNRFTEDQFSLHLPITLNFVNEGKQKINQAVRESLKNSKQNYVIGIDRGERHLIYVTVVNDKGEIIEQFSGNVIKDAKTETDYNALLDRREDERLKARQSWTTIEKIKDLKEGYVSQIVHKICQLVVKYDAVIALEDLNYGFKQSRIKVEKSVYQKFEKMLIDKLNYLVDKNLNPSDLGGLLQAYQLTEKFESFKTMGKQNGFIFFVPPYLTSKIDPTTGFVDLLKPKYINEEKSKNFIGKFKSIKYDEKEDLFSFSFDYSNFEKSNADYKKRWTIYTYGERIWTYKDKNGKFVSEEIHLTQEWKNLFSSVGINLQTSELKEEILKQSGKEFYERFYKLLRLTLQMRNSKTASKEDYLISPVKNKDGGFYDSRNYNDASKLPANADANGAYNIALKALWAIDNIKNSTEDLSKVNLSIKNNDWLQYVQQK